MEGNSISELKELSKKISRDMVKINIKSSVIGLVLNERFPLVEGDSRLLIGNYAKDCYDSVRDMSSEDLYASYAECLETYIKLSNQRKSVGRKILRLRGSRWSF